ncbi:hypothetical protein AB0L63_00190 [Nocardia sp. NPDC051990]|uniref:hypothetical protein n=1 Tax=Nocardia sp. NPDC051990 TaxID=3155285 RepID=UPI003421203F
MPAYAGQIERQGFSLTRLPNREPGALRENVALVHQDLTASLGPRHSIEDTIGEPDAPSRVLRPKVAISSNSAVYHAITRRGDPANSPVANAGG